jgi:hypothetical protein
MLKRIRVILACVALTGVACVTMPANEVAAGHGPHASHGTRSQTERRGRHPSNSGPLSYHAYWKAATSPNPPRPNQDYNRYWQKMQAWQEHHRR